jgi:hypothetical protein
MLIANKAHVFYSPHKIVFGTGTASGIGAEVRGRLAHVYHEIP